MGNFINSLRSKPKSARNRYAFVLSFFLTALIATTWWVARPNGAVSTMTPEQSREADSSFSLLFDRAKGQFAAIATSFQQLSGTSTDTEGSAEATTSEPQPAVIMPKLNRTSTSASTSLTTTASTTATTAPAVTSPTAGRPILIATTSRSVASSSQSEE